jgi:two-component system LytT family sensor kinase
MNYRSTVHKDSWRIILILVVAILATGTGLIHLGVRLDKDIIQSIGHTILISGGLWLICRGYVKFLWRKFPWEKNPVIHIIYEVFGIGILTMAFGFALYQTELLLGLILPTEQMGIQIVITLLITYLITGIHEMVHFYQQWIHHFSKSVRLEKDNIQANYETLKTQINPHFLFNSLNSLTNLVDDNPGAVKYIQHLSEFLRYMLNSRNRDLAYLREELSILNHYVSLQHQRFLDNLQVEMKIPEKYHLYALPPLALQMLVENCIKHNVISSETPLTITIYAENDYITVSNNLQRKNGVDSTGQGLANIRERYRYFTQQEVRIEEKDQFFSVSIPLLIVDL